MENFDINNLNKEIQENYIHYNPNRIDYTINDLELETLENSANNLWKDITFLTFGVAIPTLLNAYIGKCKIKQQWNDEVFYNALIGGISLVIFFLSAILWYNSTNKFKKTIKNIKSKPRFRIPN